MSSAEQLDDTHPTPSPDPEEGVDRANQEPEASRFRVPTVAEKDQSPLPLVGLRDLAAVSILLSIFGGADSWARTTELGLAQCVVTVVGLLGGAAIAAVAHEWGHFAGARLAGGHSPTKRIKAFPQVFDFDYEGNSPKSFLWMSVGGSVGNWGMALFLSLALPLGSFGPDALVSGAVAFSVFSALVEFPVIRDARAGMPGLDALMRIPKDFATRYLPHAVAAGLLTFLILQVAANSRSGDSDAVAGDIATLLALAEIAGVYIGIAALVSFIVRASEDHSRHDDVFSLANIVFLAAAAIAGALLPVVFSRFGIAESIVQRIFSVGLYAFNIIIIVVANRVTIGMVAAHDRKRRLSVIVWSMEPFFHLPLLCNVIGMWPGFAAAFYLLAMFVLILQMSAIFVDLVASMLSGARS